MTNAKDLLALAERCEQEEASRELDCDIALALKWNWCDYSPRYWLEPSLHIDAFQANPNRMALDPRVHLAFPIAFTTSLDAAVTLVPTECNDWLAGRLDQYWHASVGNEETWGAKSAALALCAASLRARAALLGGKDD